VISACYSLETLPGVAARVVGDTQSEGATVPMSGVDHVAQYHLIALVLDSVPWRGGPSSLLSCRSETPNGVCRWGATTGCASGVTSFLTAHPSATSHPGLARRLAVSSTHSPLLFLDFESL
jgi:hypothetical protein